MLSGQKDGHCQLPSLDPDLELVPCPSNYLSLVQLQWPAPCPCKCVPQLLPAFQPQDCFLRQDSSFVQVHSPGENTPGDL